mmetsp:Transcript_17211/g.25295  ORF Transcript_17211/g.25295 Transcript_17211/m.25295 type:complete len:163 (+) Transcript_17211:342-830(+)
MGWTIVLPALVVILSAAAAQQTGCPARCKDACAPESSYTSKTGSGSTCYHGCDTNGVCQIEAAAYTTGGTDCCTCAPTGFNFETGFEGRSVHENACMSDIAVAAASSSPPILSAPCQVDWDICTWFYLRVSCVCIYANLQIDNPQARGSIGLSPTSLRATRV